jgi:hypothetical protein
MKITTIKGGEVEWEKQVDIKGTLGHGQARGVVKEASKAIVVRAIVRVNENNDDQHN